MNAPIRPSSLSLRPTLAIVLAGLAACHASTEVVVVPPPEPLYGEAESNDDAWNANDFGLLAPGEHVAVLGSVRDDGYDPQDGFSFTAAGAIAVEFSLSADCPCADLDVWVYDPLADAFVGVFDSPFDPERGSLTVYGQAFHLVVVSANGDASYRLDVHAAPAGYAATGGEGASGGGAIVLGNGAIAASPTPSPALASYRRGEPPVFVRPTVEVFVVDPVEGVVARGRMPAPL